MDFLDMVESPEDIDFELVLDDLNTFDVREQEGFKYPAVLLSGVKYVDCLKILKTLKRESYRSVDIWIEVEGGPPVCQGQLPLDSQLLIVLKYLGIRVTLYLNDENIEMLDLRDGSVIERFI